VLKFAKIVDILSEQDLITSPSNGLGWFSRGVRKRICHNPDIWSAYLLCDGSCFWYILACFTFLLTYSHMKS